MGKKDELYKQRVEQRRLERELKEKKERAAARKKTLMATLITVGVAAVLVLIFLLVLRPWEENTYTSTTDTDSTASQTTSTQSGPDAESAAAIQQNYDYNFDMTVKHNVEIEVKDYGVIKLELDPTCGAPITVDNFLTLVDEGFYNGLTFHRIIDGFVMQGGDPDHDGTGGSDKEILGEFEQNGVNNTLKHGRGVISMARATPFDSASSQFFICHSDSASVQSLDGLYATFGIVTEGMEIVDAIVEDANPGNNGAITYAEQPVITEIRIVK